MKSTDMDATSTEQAPSLELVHEEAAQHQGGFHALPPDWPACCTASQQEEAAMEHWERMKRVVCIEEDLERMISQGRLPASGGLPSERMLARSYGVERGTIREALLRLAERGLIVRRQGRQARAVAIEQAVTLESVGVALHAWGSARPERLRLLEGYFALKRETAVGLLVHACAHASENELRPLQDACFMLRESARWDDGSKRWVEQEFAMLRMAAGVANRPGHFLLVQSLERAFEGMAGVVRPLLSSEAVLDWSQQTLSWLFDRDVEALRRDLSPLLLACDEHLLASLKAAPVRDGHRSDAG
ncbi:GntR family transcriptional regulator [Archangium lansingense]|uniref:GntR family transcriptional regulator n=1 Tax=Archangium lansingense TaxID=2995310 RepID=A0ABT4AP56_9BACT|nr:GntR family transcriptional regulator [Archangium lansinium]MCY1083493.1 GntR family transcriptional regulator [Archangium lansinium]